MYLFTIWKRKVPWFLYIFLPWLSTSAAGRRGHWRAVKTAVKKKPSGYNRIIQMPEPTTVQKNWRQRILSRKCQQGFLAFQFSHIIFGSYTFHLWRSRRGLVFFSEFPFPFLHPPSIFFSSPCCYYNSSNNLLCVQQGGFFNRKKWNKINQTYTGKTSSKKVIVKIKNMSFYVAPK